MLAAAAWLILVADGVAQDPGTGSDSEVILHVRDAVDLALPGLDRTGPALSSWRVKEAEGRLWPAVSVRGRYSLENSPASVLQGNSAQGATNVVGTDLRIQRYTGDVTVSYNFLQFLESGPRIRGALAEERAAVLRLNQTQSERVVRVIEAYLTLLGEQEALAGLDRLRREYTAHLAKQEAGLAIDQVPAIEIVRARSQLIAIEREGLALTRRAASAELDLRKLTGLKSEVRISPLFDPDELDFSLIAVEGLDGLLALAKDGSPRLLAANLGVEAAEWESRAVRARNSYPTFSLFGSYGYGRDEIFSGATTSRSTDFRYGVYLALELPIFDGGVRRAQIAQSNLTTESRLQLAREAARDVKAQIEDLYYAFSERQATRALLDQEVGLTRDELNQVTTRSAAGLGAETEALSVLSKLVRLRRELGRAQAEGTIKGVELVLAVGRNPLATASSSSPPDRVRTVATAPAGDLRRLGTVISPTPPTVPPVTTGAKAGSAMEIVRAEPRPAPAPPAAVQRQGDTGAAAAVRSLTDVRIRDFAAVVTVQLVTTGPIPRHSSIWLQRPPRLVIDLYDVAAVGSHLTAGLRPDTPPVTRVRVGQHPGKIRVVLDLAHEPPEPPQIVERPDGLEVLLVTRR